MAKYMCPVSGCDVLPFRNADGTITINIYGDNVDDVHDCVEVEQARAAQKRLVCDPYEAKRQPRGRAWGATLYLSRQRGKNGK